ncbi:putative acetyltransferase [uncultured delta proteobacterium]|uniref:Putative acetyltransferase n=1 Tax=uncultured delta proteobacterium TaxID=34034 RepID=A0A212JE10_9DELT|nr:putative acetyltransferase [uncultured delta proteobacterium]
MDGYSIIPALPEHAPYLAAVEQAAATVFPPGSIPESIRGDSVPLPMLLAAVAAGHLWVAVDGGGVVVGFALLQIEEGIALVGEADVVPEHAGKGLGRRLMEAVAQRAAAEGHGALYLTTFSHVPWNMPFYTRIGFSVLPEGSAPPVLKHALLEERARGMEHRVAMRRALNPQ